MNVPGTPDALVSSIAAAIAAPARARMLYALVDGRARTSTELAMVADVTPATASVHLARLTTLRLVRVSAHGKHRFYSLEGADVAATLEALSVLAGGPGSAVGREGLGGLRAARTCYDHIAGALGVAWYDRLTVLGWLSADARAGGNACDLTAMGVVALEALGVDVTATRALRRRFAYGCVDWSERRPHLGGALGAALLEVALKRRWVLREPDSRVLSITSIGRRELLTRFGFRVESPP